MRRVKCGNMQREGGGWKVLMWNHLKTNSEWPRSGPVTPLSSNEVVKHEKKMAQSKSVCSFGCAPDKQGGTASDLWHRIMIILEDVFMICISIYRRCSNGYNLH